MVPALAQISLAGAGCTSTHSPSSSSLSELLPAYSPSCGIYAPLDPLPLWPSMIAVQQESEMCMRLRKEQIDMRKLLTFLDALYRCYILPLASPPKPGLTVAPFLDPLTSPPPEHKGCTTAETRSKPCHIGEIEQSFVSSPDRLFYLQYQTPGAARCLPP